MSYNPDYGYNGGYLKQKKEYFPLISVLTPSYNSTLHIDETIQSVLRQDYPNVEHIVIDGGSTDGTLEILRRYDHLNWISEPDRGQSDALNKGFQRAKGELIAWINADDTFEPGAFSRAVSYLLAHPDVAVVYGDCYFTDGKGQITGRFVSEDFDLKAYVLEDFLPQQSAFIRKSAIEDIGGWNSSLDFVMDFDLFLRLGKWHVLKRIPHVLGSFRLHPGTKTMGMGIKKAREEKIKVLQNFYADGTLSKDVRAVERNAIHYAQANLELVKAYELFQNDQLGPARQYLDAALKLSPELGDNGGKLLIKDVLNWIGRCIDHSHEAFARRMLDNLPDQLRPHRSRITRQVLFPAIAREMILNYYGKRDWSLIREKWWTLVRGNPTYLANRGVLSIGVELFFGEKFANTARRLL